MLSVGEVPKNTLKNTQYHNSAVNFNDLKKVLEVPKPI